jgi:hypothetical protein
MGKEKGRSASRLGTHSWAVGFRRRRVGEVKSWELGSSGVLVVEVFFFLFLSKDMKRKTTTNPKKFKAHLLLIYIYGCTKFIL